MNQLIRYAFIFSGSVALFAATLGDAFAQSVAPTQNAEAPTSIVVQTISSQSGAIEWVILIQIVALLILVTLLVSGTVQDRLRVRWRKPESNESGRDES